MGGKKEVKGADLLRSKDSLHRRICLASAIVVWIRSVEIRQKHMVYISAIKKYGWEPCGTQDAITNTDS